VYPEHALVVEVIVQLFDARGAECTTYAAAGAQFTVFGKGLKVVDGSITLTDSGGRVTTIPESQWANNLPKKLTFLIPAGLSDGDYTLTVTTKYARSGVSLNEPRVVTQTITIGEHPDTGSGGGDGDLPGHLE
jgi:hypothetical protein